MNNPRSALRDSGASAPVTACNKGVRFRLACRMLRNAGHLDVQLPGQRRNESPVDWLVRLGLAVDAYAAAEALIAARGLTHVLDELMTLPECHPNN